MSSQITDKSLFIIAEGAQGYEGDVGLARALIRAAAGAGADALKLQLVYADELCTPEYKYHDLFRSLEMADAAWHGLAEYAREKKVGLMLDVFGTRSLALAESVRVPGVKVHSTDMSNVGLLSEVAACQIPLVLLSTGGCTRDEIAEALRLLRTKDVVLLHGYQGYPTPLEANHIARVELLRELAASRPNGGRVLLGFADHVPSDDPLRLVLAATSLGLGVRVLEKHLTLGLALKMEDHESALNPDEFAGFVKSMRECLVALGTPDRARQAADFGMHDSEAGYRGNTRKHVVALRQIEAGAVLSPEMLGLKRTAAAQFLCDLREVYGKRARRRIEAGTAIIPDMLSGDSQ